MLIPAGLRVCARVDVCGLQRPSTQREPSCVCILASRLLHWLLVSLCRFIHTPVLAKIDCIYIICLGKGSGFETCLREAAAGTFTLPRGSTPISLLVCCMQNMGKTSLVDEKLNKVDALKPIAEDLGCTLAQLSLAWCGESCTAAVAPEYPGTVESRLLTDRRCDMRRHSACDEADTKCLFRVQRRILTYQRRSWAPQR